MKRFQLTLSNGITLQPIVTLDFAFSTDAKERFDALRKEMKAGQRLELVDAKNPDAPTRLAVDVLFTRAQKVAQGERYFALRLSSVREQFRQEVIDLASDMRRAAERLTQAAETLERYDLDAPALGQARDYLGINTAGVLQSRGSDIDAKCALLQRRLREVREIEHVTKEFIDPQDDVAVA